MDLPEPSTVAAVHDLFAQYAHRIDGRAFDAFGELFTADADYTLGGNAQQGRDAIVAFMRSVMTSPGGVHIITNVSARSGGDGTVAAVANYLITRRPEPDAPFAVIGIGAYDATIVHDDGDWRFSRLVITPQ
jgi:uncharacterized protein (TIGR02246 family)